MQATNRLYTLDAMRGVAAIMVALYHVNQFKWLAHGGYLAVDFFFALSGLVIASAYERRFAEGMTIRQFMVARLIRLYPMYILGVAISGAVAVLLILKGSQGVLGYGDIARILATELLMLPSPVGWFELFPLNGPAWSLFYEIVINAVFAVVLVRLSTRALWVVVGVALCAVIAAIFTVSLNSGWNWPTMWAGFARVTFAFTLGMALYRSVPVVTARRTRGILGLIAVLALALAISSGPTLRPLLEFSFDAVLVPVLIMLGARLQPPVRWNSACEILGDISYPLYATHFPIVYGAAVAARWFHVPSVVWGIALVIVLVGWAYLLGKVIDPAVRGVLTRWFGGKRRAR